MRVVANRLSGTGSVGLSVGLRRHMSWVRVLTPWAEWDVTLYFRMR